MEIDLALAQGVHSVFFAGNRNELGAELGELQLLLYRVGNLLTEHHGVTLGRAPILV